MKALIKAAFTTLALALTLVSATDAHAADRYGKVNVYLQRNTNGAIVYVNALPVGQVNGPASAYDRNPGQLVPLEVNRLRTPDSGMGFALGENRVRLDMDDGKLFLTVNVESISLMDNLSLTIYENFFVLSDSRGQALANGPVQFHP